MLALSSNPNFALNPVKIPLQIVKVGITAGGKVNAEILATTTEIVIEVPAVVINNVL